MSPIESDKISEVYRLERNRLLAYIRKRTSGRNEAEDILQDVFYQLTIGFRDIRRIENLRSWIYRVADNRIIDLFRKKRHLSLSYGDYVSGDNDDPLSLEDILPSLGSTPEDEEVKQLIWEVIDRTLADLPEEQRSVFVANELEEMSFKEISDKTGFLV
ncbi:MAG TPA: sigma-70 family RNA polymerase sigma factor, partial [Bacteroidales bacterium]|nr:sigma-70 family RNA polymerase sigma factor [Bacteroidales bacterium]